MGDGKKGVAPCGHPGEAVIGQYYKCLKGCDELDGETWDDITLDFPKCPACGSFKIDDDFQVHPLFYYYNPGHKFVDRRCLDCGKCWSSTDKQ